MYYLARREVAGRYAQSAVGVFWAILQPVLLATVFSVFLGHLASVPSLPDVPYPVFAVSGMVLWLFISGSLAIASMSTVVNEALISKVYFPRAIIPFSYMFPPLVDFTFGFPVVIVTMVLFGVGLHPQILLMPVIVPGRFRRRPGGIALALGVERPVPRRPPVDPLPDRGWPVHQPHHLSGHPRARQSARLYALNPVVGLLEVYRWALFAPPDSSVLIMLVPVVDGRTSLITGAGFFQRAEQTFADVI